MAKQHIVLEIAWPDAEREIGTCGWALLFRHFGPPSPLLIMARQIYQTPNRGTAIGSVLFVDSGSRSVRQDEPVSGEGYSVIASRETIGAGEGNRTLVTCLGSKCSTIELRPQSQWDKASPRTLHQRSPTR